MGNALSNYVQSTLDALSSLFWRQKCRVMLFGLDGAGKTTLLYQLKLGEAVEAIPTIGFNVETFTYKNIEFTAWDVSGQNSLRPLWHHYLQNTSAVIFVVDASDRERIIEAAEALRNLLQQPELAGVMLLVFANKQDLPNAMTPEEIETALHIDAMSQNAHHIAPMVATTAAGLYEGFAWLAQTLSGRAES